MASGSVVATVSPARKLYEQGWRHEKGIGVAKDMEIAVVCYRKSAEEGDECGQFALGQCYETGSGVEKSLTEAFEYYRRSAEQGHARAQRCVGKLYEHGWGVGKSLTLAKIWYEKSAEQGDSEGEYCVGRCYENGWGVEKDLTQAYMWYRNSANQNDPWGWIHVGRCHEYGWGVEKNLDEAYRCYRLSAEAGNALGQRHLGRCYENGLGTEVVLKSAFEWYTKSAKQGNSSAQVNLGWCYTNGLGVEKNVRQAFHWYMRSAELGDAWGENNVGRCYEWGLGVDKHLGLAYKFYRASAEKANPWGQYNLGRCYEKGWGVTRDPKEAYRWYRASAEQGNPTAQHNLAWCYEHGWGVEKHLVQARAWYQKSADQGFAKSADALHRLPAKGVEVQVAEGGHEHERLEPQIRESRGKTPQLGKEKGEEMDALREENQRLKKEWAEDRRELDELRSEFSRLLEQDKERKKVYNRIQEQEAVRQQERVVLLTQVEEREAEILRERLALEEEKKIMANDLLQKESAAEAMKVEHEKLLQELARKNLELEQAKVKGVVNNVAVAMALESSSRARRSSLSMSEMELDGSRSRDVAIMRKLQEREDEVDLLQAEIMRLKMGWEEDLKEHQDMRAKYALLLEQDKERKVGFARVLEQEDSRQEEHKQRLDAIVQREEEVARELEKVEEGRKKLSGMLEEMENAAWTQREKHLTMVEALQARVFELEEEAARRDEESEQNIQLQQLWREEEKKRDIKKMKDLETLSAKEQSLVTEQLKEKDAEIELLRETVDKLQRKIQEEDVRSRSVGIANGIGGEVEGLESGIRRSTTEANASVAGDKEVIELRAEVKGLKVEVGQLIAVKEEAESLRSLVETLRKEKEEGWSLRVGLVKEESLGKLEEENEVKEKHLVADGVQVEVEPSAENKVKNAASSKVEERGRLMDEENIDDERKVSSTVELFRAEEVASSSKVEAPAKDFSNGGDLMPREVNIPVDGIIEATSLKYGVEDKAGEDCFGHIFRGLWGDTKVTIKKLHQQESMTQRQLTAFKNEIKMLTPLDHPSIVKVFGACATRPQLAIVTEHVSGDSLWEVLHMREEPPAWDMIKKVEMIMGMASGMVYLHSRGILHRDFNSTNIFAINTFGLLKIADAGLSKTRNAMLLRASAQERHKYGVGAPFWSAPEVLDGAILDARAWEKADMYSFAVVCSELLSMETPFGEEGEEWTLEQLKTLVHNGQRPTLGTHTPVFLKELLQAAWHPEARKRPTFGDFVVRMLEGGRSSRFWGTSGSGPTPQRCVMCMKADAVSMLTPCWHACICNDDFTELQKVSQPLCPVCREPIVGALQRSYLTPAAPETMDVLSIIPAEFLP